MKQKKLLKKIGDLQFKNILDLSEPIAAASIAQVHIAKIKIEHIKRSCNKNFKTRYRKII